MGIKSIGQMRAWAVKCMGFVTTTANFQPKEELSEQFQNP